MMLDLVLWSFAFVLIPVALGLACVGIRAGADSISFVLLWVLKEAGLRGPSCSRNFSLISSSGCVAGRPPGSGTGRFRAPDRSSHPENERSARRNKMLCVTDGIDHPRWYVRASTDGQVVSHTNAKRP
jgi:hypothetical protein